MKTCKIYHNIFIIFKINLARLYPPACISQTRVVNGLTSLRPNPVPTGKYKPKNDPNPILVEALNKSKKSQKLLLI